MPGALNPDRIPVLGICASGSGGGKTTLITALIPALASLGLKVSVIKHAHHAFDIDHPGKDSYRIRQSGAVQTLIGSRQRWALMTELAHIAPDRNEPDIAELLTHIDPSVIDIVLVEGFKQAPIPKLEVYRPSLDRPLLAESDPNIIAIAADGQVESNLPVLDLNDPVEIATFVQTWLNRQITT